MSAIESLFNLHAAAGHESAQFASKQTAAVFAANVIRRAQTMVEQAEKGNPDTGTASQNPASQETPLRQELEQALSDTVQHISDTFGGKAATAMMGIVYKRLGNEAVTEYSLGQAMLDVTRFIDSSFGIDKGDAFLAHLNGDLNKSLNAFFDNGKNEEFFASSLPVPGTGLNSGPTGITVSMGGPAAASTTPADLATDTVKSMLETIAQYRQTMNKKVPAGIQAYMQQSFGGQAAMLDMTV